MQNEFWKPGNVVKLKTPTKASVPLNLSILLLEKIEGRPFDEKMRKSTDHLWRGFTHGIIAEISGMHHKQVTTVSLFLYDPDHGIISIGSNGVPCYYDYGVDELIPWRESTDEGYELVR